MKLYHNRERIAESKAALKVIKLIRNDKNAYDDTLQALNLASIKTEYDVDFEELLNSMHTANSKIQLIKSLYVWTKKLNKLYNSQVDTTQAFMPAEEKFMDQELASPVMVYTTKHWMQGQIIQKYWKEYKHNKAMNQELDIDHQQPNDNMTANVIPNPKLVDTINEVESKNEYTKELGGSQNAKTSPKDGQENSGRQNRLEGYDD